MADSGTTVRASSFGSVAEAYDRFRPGPPLAAAEWLLPAPCRRVVDLGAGAGSFTRVLAERADRVIAVEPDARMLDVLRKRSPGVPVVRGWAEAIPLRAGGLDAVTISSAWHWMDPDRTVAETARVLRPRGVLGVIRNGADRSVDWVAELFGPRDPSSGDGEHHHGRRRFELPARAPFDDADRTTIAWSLSVSAEELVGLIGTYSTTITMASDQRDRELDRVRDIASAVVVDEVVAMPMRCRCWRAVRR
jgi:SAM-dependent methyltransferase